MRKLGPALIVAMALAAVAAPVASKAQEGPSSPARPGPVQLIPSAPPAAAARAALRSTTADPTKAAPARPPAPAPATARPPAAPAAAPAVAPAPAKPAERSPPAAAREAALVPPPPAAPAPVPPVPPGRTLRVAVEGSYPPFSELTPEGRVKGFDIDIANALCAEIKARCLLVQQDFDDIQDSLVSRQTDLVVASLSMTEERRQRYAFTDKYYQVPAKFVARKGSEQRFDNAALRGVKVGVLAGSVHANYLVDRYGGIVRIVPFPTLPEAQAALAAGEVGLVFGDALMLDLDFLRSPAGEGFQFVGPDLVDPDWFGDGIGIAVRKDDARLLESINKALAKLRADGSYRTIAERYFSFDIYGGAAQRRERKQRTAQVLPRPQRDLPQLIDGPTGSRQQR